MTTNLDTQTATTLDTSHTGAANPTVTCSYCKKVLPRDAFSSGDLRRHVYRCRVCCRERNRLNRRVTKASLTKEQHLCNRVLLLLRRRYGCGKAERVQLRSSIDAAIVEFERQLLGHGPRWQTVAIARVIQEREGLRKLEATACCGVCYHGHKFTAVVGRSTGGTVNVCE
jgi:transposase-like protein